MPQHVSLLGTLFISVSTLRFLILSMGAFCRGTITALAPDGPMGYSRGMSESSLQRVYRVDNVPRELSGAIKMGYSLGATRIIETACHSQSTTLTEIVNPDDHNLLSYTIETEALFPPLILAITTSGGKEISPAHGLTLAGDTAPNPTTTCIVCNTKRHQHMVLVSGETARFFDGRTKPQDGEELFLLPEEGAHWLGFTCRAKLNNPLVHQLEAEAKDPWEDTKKAAHSYRTLPRYPVNRVVAEALVSTREYGYHPSRGFDSTRSVVLNAVQQNPEAAVNPSVSQAGLDAELMLLWARDLEPANDFEAQVHYLATQETVTQYSFGVLCYLPSAYRRAVEADEKSKLQATLDSWQPVDAFLGDAGERVRDVPVTLRETRQLANCCLNVLSAPGGERLVVFSDTPLGKIGTKANASFTVASHDTFRGEKSTKLRRFMWRNS